MLRTIPWEGSGHEGFFDYKKTAHDLIPLECWWAASLAHRAEAWWASRGSPEVLDQRVDGGRFRLHEPEVADERAQVVEDFLAPDAAGLGHVHLHQLAQVLYVRVHAAVREPMDVDELMVVAIDEIVRLVEHVGEAAGEAGAEVDPSAAQNQDHSAGHVLAAMIAGALDDRDRAGVAHPEALAGLAGREQLAAGGAVQAGIAHDDRVARFVARALGRL